MSCHQKPSQTFTDAQMRASCGNCTAHNRKALQRVVRSAQCITGVKLPALQDTYSTRYHRKAKSIIQDNNHPSYYLFTPLLSRRKGQYRCIKVDRETEKQLLSQGHQPVKQPSLTQRGCCLHTDLTSLANLINGSLVTLTMPL